MSQQFSADHVAKHNSDKDGWIIVIGQMEFANIGR
jgi:cytochrome b involved in lipid metabolism